MNATESPAPASPPPGRRFSPAMGWLLVLFLVPLAAGLAWRAWEADAAARSAADAERAMRLDAAEQRLAALRQGQQAQGQRLQQAEATNRLLRDELLAIGQRAALLEESVQRLSGPADDAARALRLDEIELLLSQGQQRLVLAGDVDGARRAYAMAARLLDALTAPADIDLRQVLAQERAALEAMDEDPRAVALARLEAFEAGLDAAAAAEPDAAAAPEAPLAPWYRRLAARIVDVRRSDDARAAGGAERAAALAALRLELALARTAAERRDPGSHAAALHRAAAWLPRLWPASPAREARRRELEAIAALPLAPSVPELGTTLDQLRAQRGSDDGSGMAG